MNDARKNDEVKNSYIPGDPFFWVTERESGPSRSLFHWIYRVRSLKLPSLNELSKVSPTESTGCGKTNSTFFRGRYIACGGGRSLGRVSLRRVDCAIFSRNHGLGRRAPWLCRACVFWKWPFLNNKIINKIFVTGLKITQGKFMRNLFTLQK